MKKIFIVITLVSSMSALALTPQAECYNKAYSSTGLDLSKQNAINLCKGTTQSEQVLSCFKRAYSSRGLNLSAANAILLCSQTEDATQTLTCFSEAYDSSELDLSTNDALALCQR